MRRTRMWTAALVVAALGLGACSGLDGDDAAMDAGDVASAQAWSTATPEMLDDADAEAPAAEPASDASSSGEVGTVEPAGVTLGRTVIRTAAIDLEVADPSEAADEVTRIAERAGGFVGTADLRRDREGVLSGSVTIRVPSERLVAVLDELEELADGPASRRIDERDVTVEVADLEARLRNLTAYERELNELLTEVRERTADPDDLLRVFERVRSVREEIDVLEGRLAVLSDQVSLATITVGITPASVAKPVADPTWQPAATVREALTSLARTLGGLADAAIWFVIAVLPILAIVGLPVVAVTMALWRRRTPAAPAVAAATPGEGTPPGGATSADS